MSVTTCLSCDNEACKEQVHREPMAYPSEWRLPDGWLSLIPGDTQLHRAWHFCSRICLLEWASEILFEEKGEAKKSKSPGGHWHKLNGTQKANVKTLEELILQGVIAHIERFYKQHPELQIGWEFQLEPYFRKEH